MSFLSTIVALANPENPAVASRWPISGFSEPRQRRPKPVLAPSALSFGRLLAWALVPLFPLEPKGRRWSGNMLPPPGDNKIEVTHREGRQRMNSSSMSHAGFVSSEASCSPIGRLLLMSVPSFVPAYMPSGIS